MKIRSTYKLELMKNKILIINCLFILLGGCKQKLTQKESKALVEVQIVNPISFSLVYDYTGVIEESYSSMISFQVAGNIQKIYCDENEYVNKGQLLASLDKTNLQNGYDIASSTFRQAKDAYNRMKILYEDNSLPEIKWIETQTTLQKTQSMVNISQNNLNNCDLYAPFDGIIAKRITETGANVMPGVPVFDLIKLKKVKIKVPVPEKEVSNIKIGQKATVQIIALGDKVYYETEIKEKSAIANPLSHTYDVKMELENSERKLMLGMICDVKISIDNEIRKQIVVPGNSVMLDNSNNKFVWLANEDIVKKQLVVVDQFSDQGVVIKNGLKKGDLVIINGNQKLSEGTKIRTQ